MSALPCYILYSVQVFPIVVFPTTHLFHIEQFRNYQIFFIGCFVMDYNHNHTYHAGIAVDIA